MLSTSPQVRQQGGLYLQSSEKLLVRNLAGQNTSFSPRQVSSFRIDNRQFIATGGFKLQSGFGNTYVAQAFAEQLDSGQVVLLRYQPVPTGAAGRGNIGYSEDAASKVYLLRTANTLIVTPMQGRQAGAAFRAALLPYLVSRPDLTQLLETKKLENRHLPAIIHALNHNHPYSPAFEQATTN
ncbi:MAG: hypothetical protein EOO63_12070 [Hymenobacter sp.]|nr:MAG: hypothetical protein EOO63_12070 [Hymenobacter sp.]